MCPVFPGAGGSCTDKEALDQPVAVPSLKGSRHAAHAWQLSRQLHLSLAECSPGEAEGEWPWCQSHAGREGHEATRPAAPQLPVPALASKTSAMYSETRQGCRQQEPAWWRWPQPGFSLQLLSSCLQSPARPEPTPSPAHAAQAHLGTQPQARQPCTQQRGTIAACCGRPQLLRQKRQGKQGLWA